MNIHNYEVVDLFAGIGGMTLAFKLAGFSDILGIERDPRAAEIYERNHNRKCRDTDLFNLNDIPHMDVLVGRIPTPGRFNSVSEKSLSGNQNDAVYESVFRLINERRPKAFLFEIKDFRIESYKAFIECLADSGYFISHKLLNANQYNGISGRYLYILGMRNGKISWEWPKEMPCKPESFLEESGVQQEYYNINLKMELKYRPGKIYSWKTDRYEVSDHIYWNLYHPPFVCDKIGIRKMTHKELQRLKGFPDDYSIYMNSRKLWYKYILDASNVQICTKIACLLKNFLDEENPESLQDAEEREEEDRTARVIEKRTATAWRVKTAAARGAKEAEEKPAEDIIVENIIRTVIGAKTKNKPYEDKNEEQLKVKKCFVIMPFEDNLNEYYFRLVKPAMESKGYEVKRADEIYGNRAIIDDITSEIKNSDILVADATGKNPNVNYELGYAHALNKEVIIITQDINDIPFDYRHRRAIIYDPTDFDWKEKLCEGLKKTVDAVKKIAKRNLNQ